MDHDLIVVGAGAAGLGAARAARRTGADVLLVNDGPPGGDCTFTGCVPSKTLLAAAKAGLDFSAAMARVDATIQRIAATESWAVLADEGIGGLEGRARFTTHDTVVVGEQRITAPRLLVATGARATLPPIPGLADIDAATSESLFAMPERPDRLAVIGGGPIGCEMAEAFARVGCAVTLLEAEPRLLGREEPAASAAIEEWLRGLGVDVRTGIAVQQAAGGKGSPVTIEVAGAPGVVVDAVVVATGRRPNSTGMGLEELGVKLDGRGHIHTDAMLETDVRGVFAAGDVTGRMPFTHAADEQGRLAAGNALRRGHRGRYRSESTPWVTFTTLEVARVGLTEAEAARRIRGARVVELPMSAVDRAVTDGAEEGFVKLVTAPRRPLGHRYGGRIVGATIVARRAGEMINEVAVVMRSGAFAGRLAQATHAYPTWSSALQQVAGQWFAEIDGRTWRPARD